MKPVYFLFALFIVICGCKKQEEAKPVLATYREPDFALIPTKDAAWYVHTQGYFNDWYDDTPLIENDPRRPNDVDTSLHEYITVKALGKDTVMDQYTYHVYSLKLDVRYTLDTVPSPYFKTVFPKYSRLYLREDTFARKVYFGHDRSGVNNEFFLLLDFSDQANTGIKRPWLTWPDMNIMKPGNVYVGDMRLKSWDMQTVYDGRKQYFYKAIGIGSASGVLPLSFVADNWAQVKDMSFVYKGDSTHIEYPLID